MKVLKFEKRKQRNLGERQQRLFFVALRIFPSVKIKYFYAKKSPKD